MREAVQTALRVAEAHAREQEEKHKEWEKEQEQLRREREEKEKNDGPIDSIKSFVYQSLGMKSRDERLETEKHQHMRKEKQRQTMAEVVSFIGTHLGGVGSREEKAKLAANPRLLLQRLNMRTQDEQLTRVALMDLFYERVHQGEKEARRVDGERKRLKNLFKVRI